MGGQSPVPVAPNSPTPTPTGISPGSDLPAALMTEVALNTGQAAPSAVPANVSDSDRETIYGLTVLNLVRDERATTVYLNPFVGQGERLDESDPARPLGATLDKYMDSVDGEREYTISEFSEVVGPLEDGGKVSNGGVFVTLGEITSDPQSSDILTVRGTIYRGLGDAEGRLFRFQRDDNAPDGWKLLNANQEWSEQ
jgi:hypothetical protein